MNSWFRRATRQSTPRVDRDEMPVTRVDVAELAPEAAAYLGQLAYAQLAFYQFVTETARRTEPLLDTQIISRVAGHALLTHQDISAEIKARGDDPVELMAPYVERTDAFLDILRGSRGIEGVLTAYIVFGFLNDFFVSLAEGMNSAAGKRFAAAITSHREDSELADVLIRRIEAEERRAHILALWGRRVLGDTILFAHAIVNEPGAQPLAEGRVEPVFTELIARHSRRMDALGLTA
ncbi:MAG: ferritin-like fold-containing protein [Mycetocola sp.]